MLQVSKAKSVMSLKDKVPRTNDPTLARRVHQREAGDRSAQNSSVDEPQRRIAIHTRRAQWKMKDQIIEPDQTKTDLRSTYNDLRTSPPRVLQHEAPAIVFLYSPTGTSGIIFVPHCVQIWYFVTRQVLCKVSSYVSQA